MKKRYTAPWWKWLFIILTIITIGCVISYAMGGSGIRNKYGNTISVDRNADYRLFKINDTCGITWSRKYNIAELTTYKKQAPYLRWAGEYQSNRELFMEPYKSGDWYYTNNAGFVHTGQPMAYNAKTGEIIYQSESPKQELGYMPEALKKTGIMYDEKNKITLAQLEQMEELSYTKESKIALFGGLLFAYILLLLLWPFARRKVAV